MARFYDSKLPFDTPIDWWHQLDNGALADERPPPPGVTDPYPNFAQLPARPTPTDPATRRALSARLATARDRADRLAAQDPIETPAAPAIPAAPPPSDLARGGRPITGAAGAPAPEPPMARLDAADAKPDTTAVAAVPGAAPASRTAAGAAPAPRTAPAAAPAATAAGRIGSPAPAAAVAAADGGPPALPTGAPPVPTLPGIPAATFEPATPKPSPQVDAAFVAESAVLRPTSADALRALAARRAGGNVAILGGGEARSAQPEAQAAALPLAWRRARAIEDVLLASGVPTSAMRVDAAALARGGIARLVD